MSEHWTEKHRPKSLDEIVGNEGAIQSMRRWAESWSKGRPRSKALVLRGEPGTGKTSAALALANDFGWDVIEMNASDHRNATSIRRIAGLGAVSQTFSADGEFLSSFQGRRKLVILDEADNLFGREDFGGAKAIADTIKESGQPIVLIVNDYYQLSKKAPAIKHLAQSVYFRRLDRQSTVALLAVIAKREKSQAEPAALERIADNANGDLRAAVNDLQMLSEGRAEIEAAHADAIGKRNQDRELNESLRALFSATTLREAVDATLGLDKTPDELVKWIEEGIPLEMRRPAELADAFDALSRSDIYLSWTRMLQHYGLWAYARELMTGGVVLSRQDMGRALSREYRFPSHFIVLSRASSLRSQRGSVSGKLARYLHTSQRCVNDSTLPAISALVRRDRELLVRLGMDLGLDEGDVAYLLGVGTDSPEVASVIEDVRSAGKRGPSGHERPRAGWGNKKLGEF